MMVIMKLCISMFNYVICLIMNTTGKYTDYIDFATSLLFIQNKYLVVVNNLAIKLDLFTEYVTLKNGDLIYHSHFWHDHSFVYFCLFYNLFSHPTTSPKSSVYSYCMVIQKLFRCLAHIGASSVKLFLHLWRSDKPCNPTFCLKVTESFSAGQINILGRTALDTDASLE